MTLFFCPFALGPLIRATVIHGPPFPPFLFKPGQTSPHCRSTITGIVYVRGGIAERVAGNGDLVWESTSREFFVEKFIEIVSAFVDQWIQTGTIQRGVSRTF